ncbi:MAG: NADH-quinone oxidoreductase subunit M [Proteobacteria bacterium]|jgi:NADH-quinone oxidoreductase subunit M|nr:NADH-quinone oxidoreductase subunit M [Pseudomonadota bacterium]MDC0375665.1 NADH-quinone oxidoreductase subunit M [Pelagibacteraceae bacterium]
MNFPILSIIIFLPLVGVLFILLNSGDEIKVKKTSFRVSLLTSLLVFIMSLFLWLQFDNTTKDFQFVENKKWIVDFINYRVGVDGISILFVVLTAFITPICIVATYNSVTNRTKDFFIALLVMETMMLGVFCSLDLFIFYLFFEAGLIPMFLIVGIWGGIRRVYAAFKFFLYTLFGSVFMLVAIIFIYLETGTTDIQTILSFNIDQKYQYWLWLGFFASFAVKTPMWPVHTWLPDAHVEAPTSGSVILAAILLKMAGYGFIRFSLGFFPIASAYFAPLIFALSIVAVIYTSLVALMQKDMKKLIAYSSVAHMGFVTIGIFAFNSQGIEGSIFQMISHGIVSAALFLCVGVVYDRMHTREISEYGGVVNTMPRYSVIFLVFILAGLGLPGTSGFVGEFLVLIGAFKANYLVAFFAATGVVLSACYSLWLYRRVIFGAVANDNVKLLKEINKTELATLLPLVFLTILLGVFPNIILDTISVSVENVISVYNEKLLILKQASIK